MNRRSLLKSLAAVTAGLTALATRPPVEATPTQRTGKYDWHIYLWGPKLNGAPYYKGYASNAFDHREYTLWLDDFTYHKRDYPSVEAYAEDEIINTLFFAGEEVACVKSVTIYN